MDIFNHSKFEKLASEPKSEQEFQQWIEQREVLHFLEKEISDEYGIIYASTPSVFIHAMFIPELLLADQDNIPVLEQWNFNAFTGWGICCSRDDVYLSGPLESERLYSKGEMIVFGRNFDGDEDLKTYFEINQKIAHVLDLHYLPERNAWCKLNQFGDIDEVVKVIELGGLSEDWAEKVIVAKLDALTEFAVIQDFCLVRMFDFTRIRTGSFSGWNHSVEPMPFGNQTTIFGRQSISNNGSYSRGIQLSKMSKTKQ